MDQIYQRLTLAARALRYGDVKYHANFSYDKLSEEEILEAKRFFPMEKFFIFGHARSGTTLLARLIRTHPEIHCNWQANFFTRPPFLSSLVSDPEVNAWLSRKSNRWNRGQDLSPVVMRAVSDFILEREAARAGKTVVGDKSPNNLINGKSVLMLAGIYPDASLIYIVRDGRDAVLSHRLQKFIDLPDQLPEEDIAIRNALLKDPQPFLNGSRSIFTQQDLRRSARGWVRNVIETEEQGKSVFGPRYLSLRFEDLVADPNFSLERIWVFLGVDTALSELKNSLNRELSKNPDADWQREKQQQVADVIRKGLPGSWRDIYTKGDIKTFKEIAGDTLIEWGYEKDLDW